MTNARGTSMLVFHILKDSDPVSSVLYKPWTTFISSFLSPNPNMFPSNASAGDVL